MDKRITYRKPSGEPDPARATYRSAAAERAMVAVDTIAAETDTLPAGMEHRDCDYCGATVPVKVETESTRWEAWETFTCPRCEHENRVPIDTEPDPDRFR